MPYPNEIATGESLLWLEKSEALRTFEGTIAEIKPGERAKLPPVEIERKAWLPKRIVAIDGSSITHNIRNGFPGAEASLLALSVVFIDIARLISITPGEIPSPRIFNEMDSVHTLDDVLPGANIVRKDIEDTPLAFFRVKLQDVFGARLASDHESLLDTFLAITKGRSSSITCPIEGCAEKVTIGSTKAVCGCKKKEALSPLDPLRFHERFTNEGSNGEVHGEVRHVVEVLSLINVLRYFDHPSRRAFLRDFAFVLDGPLAVFGQPAWLSQYVKSELIRLDAAARKENGVGILVFGVEKSGQYAEHFQALDWSDEGGERSRYPNQTLFIPDAKYVNRNISLRPEGAKPSGADTYFGRKIFYKAKSGDHAVISYAICNDGADDFYNASPSVFPRLSDALNILDHLTTYLFQGGFMPLVRAHAHAAIPLKRGSAILEQLFANGK